MPPSPSPEILLESLVVFLFFLFFLGSPLKEIGGILEVNNGILDEIKEVVQEIGLSL